MRYCKNLHWLVKSKSLVVDILTESRGETHFDHYAESDIEKSDWWINNPTKLASNALGEKENKKKGKEQADSLLYGRRKIATSSSEKRYAYFVSKLGLTAMGVSVAKRRLWISMVLSVQQVEARRGLITINLTVAKYTRLFAADCFRRFCRTGFRAFFHLGASSRHFLALSIVRFWRDVDLPVAFERIKFLRHVPRHIPRGERAESSVASTGFLREPSDFDAPFATRLSRRTCRRILPIRKLVQRE